MQKQAKVMARKTSFPVLYRNVFFSKTGQKYRNHFLVREFFFCKMGAKKKCFIALWLPFKNLNPTMTSAPSDIMPTHQLAYLPNVRVIDWINVKMNQIWNSCHLVRQLCKVSTRSYGLCHQSLKKLQKHWYIAIDWLNKDYCTKFYYMLSSLILEANAWV